MEREVLAPGSSLASRLVHAASLAHSALSLSLSLLYIFCAGSSSSSQISSTAKRPSSSSAHRERLQSELRRAWVQQVGTSAAFSRRSSRRPWCSPPPSRPREARRKPSTRRSSATWSATRTGRRTGAASRRSGPTAAPGGCSLPSTSPTSASRWCAPSATSPTPTAPPTLPSSTAATTSWYVFWPLTATPSLVWWWWLELDHHWWCMAVPGQLIDWLIDWLIAGEVQWRRRQPGDPRHGVLPQADALALADRAHRRRPQVRVIVILVSRRWGANNKALTWTA